MQAAGLTALDHGHLDLVYGEGGYQYLTLGLFSHWGLPAEGKDHLPPIGSTMLNVLAWPVLQALQGLASALGYAGALAVVAAAILGLAASRLPVLSQSWADGRRRAWLAAGGAAFGLASGIGYTSAIPASPLLEMAAIMLVSLAAAAGAATLLFATMRDFMRPAAAAASALVFLFGTPALFWASGIKYHALSLLLVAACVWLTRQGKAMTPKAMAAAFAVAGLALWNQLPVGGLLLVALSVVSLPALLRSPVRQASMAAVGLAAGVVPLVLERLALRAEGVQNQYLTIWPLPAAQPLAAAPLLDLGRLGYYLQASAFADPAGAAKAWWTVLVWADWRDISTALSFLCLAPFLVAAVLVLVAPGRFGRLPRPLVAWVLASTATVLVFMGRFLLDNGFGVPDPRHAATLWPLAVLAASPAIAACIERRGLRWFASIVGGAALTLLLPTLAGTLLYHRAVGSITHMGMGFEVTWVPRHAAPAVAALLLAASLAAARGRIAWKAFDTLLALSFALPFATQALLQFGWERSPPGLDPFVLRPAELIHRWMRWFLGSY